MRQEITRTPRIVNNPEGQPCTHEDLYASAQQEIAEHSAVSHEAFTRLYDNQPQEVSSAREEWEERYWRSRFEAERIRGEKYRQTGKLLKIDQIVSNSASCECEGLFS